MLTISITVAAYTGGQVGGVGRWLSVWQLRLGGHGSSLVVFLLFLIPDGSLSFLVVLDEHPRRILLLLFPRGFAAEACGPALS